MSYIPLLDYKQHLSTQVQDGKPLVFDPIRKKQVVLQPEELVRQLLIQYFLIQKSVSRSLIAVERQIQVLNHTRRFDLLVFNSKGNPDLLVECKAPDIPLTQDVFDQIARYNYAFKVPYLLVCNGMESIFFEVDYVQERMERIEDWFPS